MIVDPSTPQAQPLPNPKPVQSTGIPMGGGTGNPILDEIHAAHESLSPPAQQAIEVAHGTMGLSPSDTDAAIAPEAPLPARAPSIAPSEMVGTSPLRAVGADGNLATPPQGMGGSSPISATPSASAEPLSPRPISASPSVKVPSQGQSELMRVTGRGENPREGLPGWRNIHNPFLKTLAGIGDVVGSGLYPGISQFIPGTSAHHNLQVVPQAEQAVEDEQTQQKIDEAATTGAATREHLGAETEESRAHAHSLLHPVPKEEMEGKTVTTESGIFQWNPASKRYDVKVGDAPADKGAITHFLDKDGNAWKLNHDGSATPIHGPAGTQLQGTPTGPEGEKPLRNVEQMNKALEDRYHVLHPKEAMPEHFRIPDNATQKDYDRIDKALEATERAFGTKAQQDQVNEMRKQTLAIAKEKAARDPNVEKEYNSVHDDLNKKFGVAEDQLQNIVQAKAEINSGAMGQAFGTIKSLVALAGGKGSGVRITQAELDSIAKARGIEGGFEGWVNGLLGKGKLSGEQVTQLNTILDEVKKKGDEKRAMLAGTLDELSDAKTVAEIRAIEKKYRDGGTSPERPKGVPADAVWNPAKRQWEGK